MMHDNSVGAFRNLNVTRRHKEILLIFQMYSRPLTDREVKTLGGWEDMDDVRPRISELIALKILKQCGDVVDEITRKKVRISRVVLESEKSQEELF